MLYRHYLFTLACVVSFAFAQPALACSVCFVSKKENLMAFFATGVLLSLLPFVLVGGIGLWLYRQAKAQRSLRNNAEETAGNLLDLQPTKFPPSH